MDTYTQKGMATGMEEQSASRMMEEEPPDPAGGMVVDNVTIRKAKNGGFIVSCSKRGTGDRPTYDSSDYTFGSLAEAVPFLEQEFGASAAGPVPGPVVV